MQFTERLAVNCNQNVPVAHKKDLAPYQYFEMETGMNNEILAPAGSKQAVYAAVAAGADAVYIGGQLFGARAYAENPDTEGLLQVMDHLHIHSKKMYLTVNTLLKDSEVEQQLYDYLLPLYCHGLDAVIVQDLGVFHFIRRKFPKLQLHASTQMAVTGVEGAALLKKWGASRVVTARELSLAELREIHETVPIELESFIHGAMCYCYSGMCLFSSMIGGRSGNRGRCAGSCRQPYEIYQGRKRLNTSQSLYALSLKDMNTLSILPEIIRAGVYSLKIEGRMKSPEYVAGVVSIYRKYLDLYYEKGEEHYKPAKEDMQLLAGLYSRSGSTIGYYKEHNGKHMVSFQKPAYKTENDAILNTLHTTYCEKPLKYPAQASVTIEVGKPVSMTVSSYLQQYSANTLDNSAITKLPGVALKNHVITEQSALVPNNVSAVVEDAPFSVTVFGETAAAAVKKPLDRESVLKQLRKTGDSLIEWEEIHLTLEENVFIPISKLNDLRRTAIREFEIKLLSRYERETPVKTLFCNSDTINDRHNNRITNSLSCQVATFLQLSCVLSRKEVSTVYLLTDGFSWEECVKAIEQVLQNDKRCVVELPYIYRSHGKQYMKKLRARILQKEHLLAAEKDGRLSYLAKNIDELGSAFPSVHTDTSLYVFNRYAKEALYEMGAKVVTLPYELNYHELQKLTDHELQKLTVMKEKLSSEEDKLSVAKEKSAMTVDKLTMTGDNTAVKMPLEEDNRDELVVYGYTPLMVTAGCLRRNLQQCDPQSHERYILRDRRGAEFKAVCCCQFCYNVIYNSVPLSLLGVSEKVFKLGLHRYRVNFTMENAADTEEILDQYIKSFYYRKQGKEQKHFTRGHFTRGVE